MDRALSELKGTQTETNILTAFAGESQARNRYGFYAKKAEKEGYPQIAEIFLQTAEHERQHANRLFKLLQGGEVQIAASFPAGVVGSTAENLKAAAAGENHESTEMYPEFAATARKEGFEKVAQTFEAIGKAEELHERRYLALAEKVEKDGMFKREQPVKWMCRKCGFVHEGETAPDKCPSCAHPTKHFEVLYEGWM